MIVRYAFKVRNLWMMFTDVEDHSKHFWSHTATGSPKGRNSAEVHQDGEMAKQSRFNHQGSKNKQMNK